MLRKKIIRVILTLLLFPVLITSVKIQFNAVQKPTASVGFASAAKLHVPVTSQFQSAQETAGVDLAAGGLSGGRQVLDMLALTDFSAQVASGGPDLVAGLFLSSGFAFPVIQQPPDSPAYVSARRDEVTQFAMADEHGTIGVLAHNYLAGIHFGDVLVGQDLFVVYGDGTTTQYRVTQIRRFQALQPDSTSSDFIDLETRRQYTSDEVFSQIYEPSGRLVLQTCIAGEGSSSWGRLFLIAERTN